MPRWYRHYQLEGTKGTAEQKMWRGGCGHGSVGHVKQRDRQFHPHLTPSSDPFRSGVSRVGPPCPCRSAAFRSAAFFFWLPVV